MTREEAKKWFEEKLAGELPTGGGVRPAYDQAVAALAQPKFVAVREGEVAVLEVERRLTPDQWNRIRESWEAITKTKAIVLDGGVKLAGAAAGAATTGVRRG